MPPGQENVLQHYRIDTYGRGVEQVIKTDIGVTSDQRDAATCRILVTRVISEKGVGGALRVSAARIFAKKELLLPVVLLCPASTPAKIFSVPATLNTRLLPILN